jgi:beta-lactam-binding protein with PASTA domain
LRHGLFSAVSAVLVLSLLAGCGQSTPDTEGQTLAQAQQTLRDAGVAESNITVTGESGDPNSLIVCDHDPDNVDPSEPLTLQVAQSCPDDDDGKKKKKKKSSSSKRR